MCNFSYQHYKKILNVLKKLDYKFCFFSQITDSKIKKVYIRHDVDVSLDKALTLAKLEYEQGVRSTYFIRLTAPFYNIFDPTCIKNIKKIVKLNHHIGLHFDEHSCHKPVNQSSVTIEILREFSLLNNYFDCTKIVSFHRPSSFILNENLRVGGFINTYDKFFFKKMKYISDSNGMWKKECPCKLSNGSSSQNLQILLHPIWWGRKEKDVSKHLYQYLKEKMSYFDLSLDQEIKSYRKFAFSELPRHCAN